MEESSSPQSRIDNAAEWMPQVTHAVCVVMIGLAMHGCNSPAASEQHAVEAQEHADMEHADALLEAAETSAAAEGTASTTIARAYADARQVTVKSQAVATAAANEAHGEIVDARAELRAWATKQFEAIDRDIANAKIEAAGKTARVRATFTVAINDVDDQRTGLLHDLTTLDTRAAEDWAAFKTGYEARINALEGRISEARARL
jgi:hypothetical protein